MFSELKQKTSLYIDPQRDIVVFHGDLKHFQNMVNFRNNT